MKSIRKIIILIIIPIAMSFFLKLDFVEDNHFNLITVNAVFIGFLFTSLSIMLGFLNESIIQFFEKAGVLKKVYNNIEKGIFYSIISVVLSLINLTISEKYISDQTIINLLYSTELFFLIATIYCLLYTIKDLKIVVDSIRISKVKKAEKEKADSELDNILKDNR
ncbi:hypothetical protein DP129_11020 [Clostridium tetani]|uniref:hypothetical protein n=1 Tax=Clostridium tetani TaxID=1513 RepID=UPI00100A4267|nr:hypothetical protein [Clostridium tetani]RXI38742.1 hypothetical protein DP129_11020 [Clostridium tetani]